MKKKKMNTANFGEASYLEAMLSLLVERSVLNYIYSTGKVVKNNVNEYREFVVSTVQYFIDSTKSASKIIVLKNGHDVDDVIAEYPAWDICAALRDFPFLIVEDIYHGGFYSSTADREEFFIVRAK